MFFTLLFNPSHRVIIGRIIFHIRTQRIDSSDHPLTPVACGMLVIEHFLQRTLFVFGQL